jgi:hypothetical protein
MEYSLKPACFEGFRHSGSDAIREAGGTDPSY